MSTLDKKSQFEQQKKNRMPLVILAIALAVVGAVAVGALLPADSGGLTPLPLQNGIVQIPRSDLADGQARFYQVKGSSGAINFFLVESRDGEVRAAFDTCDVCYAEKKGYRQEGDTMVCNNCNQAFNTDLINVVKGGCNPAPLQREVRGDQVVIQLAALEQGSWYFNGHPQ